MDSPDGHLDNQKASFLVNGKKVLEVKPLIHSETSGEIGFFVDFGKRAYYKNINIQVKD